MLASIGTEMQSVAVGWELYERTKSATALGLVGLVQFLPMVLLSLPAGQAADRYNRKWLLVSAQLLTCSSSLGLALFSSLAAPVPLLYVCLLLTGIGKAFAFPARWALLPLVVSESALGNAIAWGSSGWQVASVLGPALGGFVLAATGRAASVYLLAACCLLCCVGLIASLRPRPDNRRHEPVSLHSLLAGVRFVRQTRLILATITLDLFAVLLGGATALLPIYAKDILQAGPTGLGWLRAAPSLGALIMALALAHRPLRRAGPTMLGAVAGFGIATIGFGLSHYFLLSFVLLTLVGALDNISVVVRGTLIQVLTPDHMRGRVSAVNAIFVFSSNELGAFESGITAALFGPAISVVGGGIGTVVIVLAVMAIWPELLRLDSLRRLPFEDSKKDLVVPSEAGAELP
jgi:MFS family permease